MNGMNGLKCRCRCRCKWMIYDRWYKNMNMVNMSIVSNDYECVNMNEMKSKNEWNVERMNANRTNRSRTNRSRTDRIKPTAVRLFRNKWIHLFNAYHRIVSYLISFKMNLNIWMQWNKNEIHKIMYLNYSSFYLYHKWMYY